MKKDILFSCDNCAGCEEDAFYTPCKETLSEAERVLIKKKSVVKHQPPDLTAIKMLLEIEPAETDDLALLSDEDLALRLEKLTEEIKSLTKL